MTGGATPPLVEAKADVILRAVDHIGIDAITPGDGDLALGLDWLVSRADELELPYVCANLRRADGSSAFSPWRIVESGGIRIGIFGVTGNHSPSTEFKVTDATVATREAVAALADEGCQVIIGLSHLGDEQDAALAAAVDGIDFLLGAHDRKRQEFPIVAGTSETILTRAGYRGRSVGRLQVTFAEGGHGYHDASLAARAASRRTQTQQRLDDLDKSLAAATTDGERTRLERSIERTKGQLDGLAFADRSLEGRHTLAVSTISLGGNVADDPEVVRLLQESAAAEAGNSTASLSAGAAPGLHNRPAPLVVGGDQAACKPTENSPCAEAAARENPPQRASR